MPLISKNSQIPKAANMNNINEIKAQYPSLQKWSDEYAFELYKKIREHQLITEFLYTVSPTKTTEQIVKQAGYGISIQSLNSSIIRLKFDTLTKEYLDKVNKVMDSFGWYPSYIRGREKDAGKYSTNVNKFIEKHGVVITYEAKYDVEIVPSTQYAYHLTFDLKWPKIKVLGLTPKTQGKLSDHPGRIYVLFGELSENDMNEFGFNLLNAYIHKEKVESIYLLKIDLSKTKDTKFFADPNYYGAEDEKAAFTYQNIPPNAISVDKKIKAKY